MSPAAHLKSKSVTPAQFCAKVTYPSRAEARKHLRKTKIQLVAPVAASARMGPLYVYECSACGYFHLAHKAMKGKR